MRIRQKRHMFARGAMSVWGEIEWILAETDVKSKGQFGQMERLLYYRLYNQILTTRNRGPCNYIPFPISHARCSGNSNNRMRHRTNGIRIKLVSVALSLAPMK